MQENFLQSLQIDVKSVIKIACDSELDSVTTHSMRTVLEAVLVDRDSREWYLITLMHTTRGRYRHCKTLSESTVKEILESRLFKVDDQAMAEIATNPTAILQLSWEIAEQMPESWAEVFDRHDEYLSRQPTRFDIMTIARKAWEQAEDSIAENNAQDNLSSEITIWADGVNAEDLESYLVPVTNQGKRRTFLLGVDGKTTLSVLPPTPTAAAAPGIPSTKFKLHFDREADLGEIALLLVNLFNDNCSTLKLNRQKTPVSKAAIAMMLAKSLSDTKEGHK